MPRMVGLLILFLFAQTGFACGTPDDWMDAYLGEGERGGWRSEMGRYQALVMLQGCEGMNPSRLSDEQALRMARVLGDALNHREAVTAEPMRDLHHLDRFRDPDAFHALLETIYRRYDCLGAADTEARASLIERFGTRFCPGGERVTMHVNAPSGGRLRATPGGRHIFSLRNGESLRVLGREGEWYRVFLPSISHSGRDGQIAFIHHSIVAP